jgi:hypothetical protein
VAVAGAGTGTEESTRWPAVGGDDEWRMTAAARGGWRAWVADEWQCEGARVHGQPPFDLRTRNESCKSFRWRYLGSVWFTMGNGIAMKVKKWWILNQ